MSKSSKLSAFLPQHVTAAISEGVAIRILGVALGPLPISMGIGRLRPTCLIASQAKPIRRARSVTSGHRSLITFPKSLSHLVRLAASAGSLDFDRRRLTDGCTRCLHGVCYRWSMSTVWRRESAVQAPAGG
jgi:hypothetical protein